MPGGFLEPGRQPGDPRSRLRARAGGTTSLTRCRARGNSVLGRRGVSPALGADLLGAQPCPASSPPLCHSAGQPAAPVVMAAAGGVSGPPSPPAPAPQCCGRPSALGPSSQGPGTNHLSSSPGHHSCLSLSLFCSLPSSPSDTSSACSIRQEPFISTVLYSAP